ncbi:hypothetical protein A3800_30975 [Streptomyces badius]|nr:hypothetical protein A3800_30975 [Streptomyces badius]
MIRVFSASSGISTAVKRLTFRPSRSSPPPATRMLRTHWEWPRAETRYRSPSKVWVLTGMRCIWPLLRPRTDSSAEPIRLKPCRASQPTTLLKRLAVALARR